MESALAWITGDTGRIILTLVFSFVWKQSPATVTRALPIVNVLGNILLALANAMVTARPDTSPALFTSGGEIMLAATRGSFLETLLRAIVDGLWTYVVPTGAQSGVKNFAQWQRDGGGFLRKSPA